jgi:hypothetical protein
MTRDSTCDLTCDSLPALACDAPGEGIFLRLDANAGTESLVTTQVDTAFKSLLNWLKNG